MSARRMYVLSDASLFAFLDAMASDRTERRIAGWLEAQPRRLGVDLAATCSIQLAVPQDQAAAVIGRWRSL